MVLICIFPAWCSATGESFLITGPKQVNAGDPITVSVYASSPDQAMNAVSGEIVLSGGGQVSGVSRDGSIINFWTVEPKGNTTRVRFEGVVLNPGFQGTRGKLFSFSLIGKRAGTIVASFSDGAILANDGQGTNILQSLGVYKVEVIEVPGAPVEEQKPTTTNAIVTAIKSRILPVITEYSPSIESTTDGYLRGRGEPGALTKIIFKDTTLKSIGEEFMDLIQVKKKKLDEVLIRNDETGAFEYTTPRNIVAGVYNATPFLVDNDTQSERPGFGVQIFVRDSKLVHVLIIAINVLGLLIPIVGLIVIIYFIPWYSFRKMRIMRRRMGLEEEKLELTEHQLMREDKILDKGLENISPKP